VALSAWAVFVVWPTRGEAQDGCRDIVKAEQHLRACRQLASEGRCGEALERCESAVTACAVVPVYRQELERQRAACAEGKAEGGPSLAGQPCDRKRVCQPGLSCQRGKCAVEPGARKRALEYHVNARSVAGVSPCDARELLELACTIASTAGLTELSEGVERDLMEVRRACTAYDGYRCIRSLAPASPDGMEVVLVEGGPFLRGSDPAGIDAGLKVCRQTYASSDKCDVQWFRRESPQREIVVDAFYLDKYEVSNVQWGMCAAAGGCPKVDYARCSLFEQATGRWKVGGTPHPDVLKPNHPVVCVTWEEAQTYCEWAGKRLPTEAEWEKGARGVEDARQFPWGNEWNGAGLNWGEVTGFGSQDGYETTAPVGAYATNVSPWGAMDMAGNVWEWAMDFHSDDFYEVPASPNPINATETANRVMRGGSWSFAGNGARVSYRYFGNPFARDDGVGFRCVVPAR